MPQQDWSTIKQKKIPMIKKHIHPLLKWNCNSANATQISETNSISWGGDKLNPIKAAFADSNEYNFIIRRHEGWKGSVSISSVGHLKLQKVC